MNKEAIIDIENPKDNDLISRQEAVEAFQIFREYESNRSNKGWVDRIETVLNQLPPVTPQPKTGHWIIKDSKEQGYDIGGVKTWYIQIKCSECEFIKTAIEGHTGQYHYCPQCGAKMQEVEE